MNQLKAPKESLNASEILRCVCMDHLLVRYEQLVDRMTFVQPSELATDLSSFDLVGESVLVLLPSPFRAPDDRISSVVVLPENNVWDDLAGLKPADIPNDVIGFVMAYERCSYQDAVSKLSIVAAEIQQSDPDELVRELAEIRRLMQLHAERLLTIAEVSTVRERILRRLDN